MVNNTPIAPGYRSTYGGTLLQRGDDWLVLTAMSTHGNAGGIWALAAMTAPNASGYAQHSDLPLSPLCHQT